MRIEQCRIQQNELNNAPECKKSIINAQYTINRDYPTHQGQGVLKGTNYMYMKSQGRLPGSSPLRSDGSRGSQTGGWTALTVAKSIQRESWKTTLSSLGT
jgi:hypothetical protein